MVINSKMSIKLEDGGGVRQKGEKRLEGTDGAVYGKIRGERYAQYE